MAFMKGTLITTTLTMILAGAAFAQPGATVFSAAGENADAIRGAVDAFRNALGPVNAPGPDGNPEGRREINWDGVPQQFSSPNQFPGDFFNKNSVRGVVFTVNTPGWNGFQVSGNEGEAPVRFDNLYQGNSQLFTTFSAQKLFTSTGTHAYDVDFKVPGTELQASSRGFGAVFTNVAIPFTTPLEFYSVDGVLLGRYSAPVAAKGLSFVGVAYPSKMVSRVRVIPGNAALGTPDDPANGVNVVALDDFIYGEPSNPCAVR